MDKLWYPKCIDFPIELVHFERTLVQYNSDVPMQSAMHVGEKVITKSKNLKASKSGGSLPGHSCSVDSNSKGNIDFKIDTGAGITPCSHQQINLPQLQ